MSSEDYSVHRCVKPLFDFTEPYFSIETGLFFNHQMPGFQDLDDLSGFRVGVIKGDSAEDILSDRPDILMAQYPGCENLVKAALSGEIRVFAADTYIARFYLAKLDSGGTFRESIHPVAINKQYAAVRKGNQQLLEIVQSGFDKISEKEKTLYCRNVDRKSSFFQNAVDHSWNKFSCHCSYTLLVAFMEYSTKT